MTVQTLSNAVLLMSLAVQVTVVFLSEFSLLEKLNAECPPLIFLLLLSIVFLVGQASILFANYSFNFSLEEGGLCLVGL